ncbi:hypothetical protein BOTBODRAFT_609845 [Botryobasidium botryosum FD-172 SS1]|uniref:BTB domain-containing protein n=1 Tax=Botryobasidium botryosum (strain FD-172 SS1) TaxID=930990 RepID=A0A067LYI6_BOTB1|nr:hypothetical protein BOTBODRAFT_609845 [Botryobasidium botryosum FD-172 SS1]
MENAIYNGIAETSFSIRWRLKLPPLVPDEAVNHRPGSGDVSTWTRTRGWNVSWKSFPARDRVEIAVLPPRDYDWGDCSAMLPATTDVYITATGNATYFKPMIHYLSYSSHIVIPWAEVAQLLSPGNTVVEICVIGSLLPCETKVVSPAPSTRKFLSFTRILGELDEPLNHDVVFRFPEGQCLYADARVLQSASPYFAQLLRGDMPRISDNGVEETAAPPTLTPERLDVDIEGLDEADDSRAKGSLSRGPLQVPSEHLPKKRKRMPFSPTLEPERSSMQSIFVTDATYPTFRAVIYYLYSEYIVFAPLSSLSTGSAYSQEEQIDAYMKEHPARPTPVSPTSAYVLAIKFQVPALQVAALHKYNCCLEKANIPTELFSDFCRLYEKPRDLAVQCAIKNWSTVRYSKQWTNATQAAKLQQQVTSSRPFASCADAAF